MDGISIDTNLNIKDTSVKPDVYYESKYFSPVNITEIFTLNTQKANIKYTKQRQTDRTFHQRFTGGALLK